MRALVYQGPYQVSLENVPDPTIEHAADALVRITTTNICGSDLHMYEGRTSVEEGKILGHENMGVVQEVGSAVTRVKVGDRVSLPFNVACGTCKNCERGYTGFCLQVNPGMAGGAYGYADMGPYRGGQAEYLRVPFADFNCLRLPEGNEHELDYTMLSDIFPTGWHGTRLADLQPGDSVVVFGAGPVGLMAAYSATIQGASKVMIVDKEADRLALAEKIGVIPVDYGKADTVEQVMELTGGEGADKGVEAVGYQAHDAQGDEETALVMNQLVACVRATGQLGVVGVYMPADPGAANDLAKEGKMAFDFGTFFQKGLRMGTGQANVKAYNRQLRDLIAAGKASPSFLVSQELPLSDIVDAYGRFDRREQGWTKVVLHPDAA